MGNAVCIGKSEGLDSICAGRGLPEFIAPNTEHVTYCFNYARDHEISLLDGLTADVSARGFALDPQVSERRAPRWYNIKQYVPSAAQLRLHVSGRVLVQCPDEAQLSAAPSGACAFRICTRGHPIYESIRTDRFTHTAHVVTSGVFFAFNVSSSLQGLYLCPRLVAVLEGGDEVTLVDDRLGPMRPQSHHVDFAILDDGGRNIQVDLIFRGVPDEGAPERGMRTLRTCLQDYIAFNNQVAPASISLGPSELASLLPRASLHLQNLVVSEERLEDRAPRPRPLDVWGAWPGRLLYEGEDARAASAAAAPDAPAAHPQLQPPQPAAPEDDGGARALRRCGAHRESLAETCTDDFWHHVRYDDHPEIDGLANPDCPEDPTHLRGEFWLSKQVVDKKSVYFHCSSTIAQATTMCVAFRFSCPPDYLQLIERASGCGAGRQEAVSLLREGHIPANGVVLGLEHDPRHRGLLRMFVEHRNEIKDDMVVCECHTADLAHAIAHQEVYDGGGVISYRVTLLHRDGTRQSAVLQASAEDLEDAGADSAHPGNQYRLVEEPSLRFPLLPCQVSQSLSPASRVFVYTASVHEPSEGPAVDIEGGEPGDCPDERLSAEGMATPTAHHLADGSHMSDATAEDWQSVGGGFSDCEVDAAHHVADPHRARLARGCTAEDSASVRWRRPLIESAVLVTRMEEAPFKCFPMSLS